MTTASIGITLSTEEYGSPEDVLRDATIALNRAKSGGAARYEIFDPAMYARVVERLQLEADLRRAVEQHEFELHYQPIVSTTSYKIVGVEALVRWQHPERGFVLPGDFIPIAEETGLITLIGDWVLHAACQQINDWRDAGLQPVPIAVNLAAQQLKQLNFAASIANMLEKTGVEPRYLKLELTESDAMENAAATILTLRQLSVNAIELALDDFGTGYSSLSYLTRFPISTLKIDKSFVQNMTRDPAAAAIASTIIAMAHNLQLQVVAEGVETEDQLRFLAAHQCDKVQGYLFGRPVPAGIMTAMLRAGKPLRTSAPAVVETGHASPRIAWPAPSASHVS